mgnify:CR=1 FL=1
MLNAKNLERVRKMRVHVSRLGETMTHIGHAMVHAIEAELEASQLFGHSPHIEWLAAAAGYQSDRGTGRYDTEIDVLAFELAHGC